MAILTSSYAPQPCSATRIVLVIGIIIDLLIFKVFSIRLLKIMTLIYCYMCDLLYVSSVSWIRVASFLCSIFSW